MKLVYPSAKSFAKALEVVWNIIDEGTFKVNKDGMRLIALDPGKSYMISFFMPKEHFSEYEVEGEKRLALDINYLKSILKRARQNEKLYLSLEEDKLGIVFKGPKSKRTFSAPLLDLVDSVDKEIPLEYVNSVKIDASALKDILKDASIVSNYITFGLTPDAFSAKAKSSFGHVKEEFEKGEDVISLEVEKPTHAMYSIKFLDDLLKPLSKGDILTLHINSPEAPLKIEFTLEGAKLKYFLASASEEEE